MTMRLLEAAVLIGPGDFAAQVGWEVAECCSDAFDADGSDLFGSGPGVARQSRAVSGQEGVKGADPGHVACRRDDGDDAALESLGGGVGAVVADDDGGASATSVISGARLRRARRRTTASIAGGMTPRGS
jgi:hypothetical protein